MLSLNTLILVCSIVQRMDFRSMINLTEPLFYRNLLKIAEDAMAGSGKPDNAGSGKGYSENFGGFAYSSLTLLTSSSEAVLRVSYSPARSL